MTYSQPLALYFIWNTYDEENVSKIVNHCYDLFSNDTKQPFSRALNIPVFFRASSSEQVPIDIEVQSDKSIAFIFVSKEISIDESWIEYIKKINNNPFIICIPIALDIFALNIGPDLGNINFIRAYEYEEPYYNEKLFISIAHEVYRHTMVETKSKEKLGKDKALKLFISHAKDNAEGIRLAKALKENIDKMGINNFFDATDIAKGYQFDEEIVNQIKTSTIIAILSDVYSSRYWCQREIICAKENERPIVAVDILSEYEDRRFPHSMNVPSVHCSIDEKLEEATFIKILTAALIETIRVNYSKRLLYKYQEMGIVGPNTVILTRPPEAYDIRRCYERENDQLKIVNNDFLYPDPPVYDEELDYLKDLGLNFYTPISLRNICLNNHSIGISISNPLNSELMKIGLSSKILVQLIQELSRHLLAREATLVFGGDLRAEGFTEYMLKEAMVLNARLYKPVLKIINYISWPIYNLDSEKLKEWKSEYRNLVEMNKVPLPDDLEPFVSQSDKCLPSDVSYINDRYAKSRALTLMRQMMIGKSDIQIFAGGKFSGYSGRMPGILEEFYFAVSQRKPIFLLGGFGGVTSSICDAIATKTISEKLTQDWQQQNQNEYTDLLAIYDKTHKWDDFDYDKLDELMTFDNLNNGLSEADNRTLFKTQFVDEAIQLVLKGVAQIAK